MEAGKTLFRGMALILFLGLAAGCIHTSTGGYRGEPDREKALSDNIRLGMAYLSSGDTHRAKRPLINAIEIAPRSAEAHNALGLVYYVDQEFALAEEHYRKAIQYDPAYTKAYFNFGALLYNRGRYPEAVHHYRVATADTLYEQRPAAFENLGYALLAMGDRAGARAAFTRALSFNRDLPRSHLSLARMYFDDENYDASLKHFQRFAGLSRHSAESLWLGIRLQRVLNDRDALASYALQLRNMYPESDEYQLYRESIQQ